jgi:hypothetical protein
MKPFLPFLSVRSFLPAFSSLPSCPAKLFRHTFLVIPFPPSLPPFLSRHPFPPSLSCHLFLIYIVMFIGNAVSAAPLQTVTSQNVISNKTSSQKTSPKNVTSHQQ